jgi:hypothetical protein
MFSNKVAEANSFKTTHKLSSGYSAKSWSCPAKAIDKTESDHALGLSITHRRVKTVDAIPIIHLAICNNNGNKALSTRMYSARLTRHKLN